MAPTQRPPHRFALLLLYAALLPPAAQQRFEDIRSGVLFPSERAQSGVVLVDGLDLGLQ